MLRKAVMAVLLVWASAVPGMSADKPVVIAALGDSLTQGYGLPPEEGFVPQLQSWLDAAGAEARVLNAGVSGDTTAGGLSRVGWTLTPDVDALIVALGGNDVLRGIAPGTARANLDGILAAAHREGVAVLLVGMQAPLNFGPQYKQDFDGIFPELAEKYGAFYMDSFFAGLGTQDPAKLGRYLQPDGIHPNSVGVSKIVEGFGPRVLRLIEAVD